MVKDNRVQSYIQYHEQHGNKPIQVGKKLVLDKEVIYGLPHTRTQSIRSKLTCPVNTSLSLLRPTVQ